MLTLAQRAVLRAEILERVPSAVRDTRDTLAIAQALSEGRTRPNKVEIGHGLILETLGLEAGNRVLDLVHNDSTLRYVRPLVEQGRLVVASELVAGWFAGLVSASVLTQEQADAVLALGRDPAPVSEFEVRCACVGENGEWLL